MHALLRHALHSLLWHALLTLHTLYALLLTLLLALHTLYARRALLRHALLLHALLALHALLPHARLWHLASHRSASIKHTPCPERATAHARHDWCRSGTIPAAASPCGVRLSSLLRHHAVGCLL